MVLVAAWALLTALGAMMLLLAPRADAKQKFMSGFGEAFPAAAGSALDSCLLCHTDPVRPREENLNQFGEDWEDGDIGDKDFLAPNLLNRDSDGDGVKNGAEIQQLSLPGDPSSSSPPTTTTTLPGTPPDGQALFAAGCSACHGPNGGDLSGTALGRSTFISITVNGQGGMPAQTNLTNEEVGAIWEYVTGAAPPTTTTTLPGATTTTTAPAPGAQVWSQHCAACHGANGGNVVPTSSSRNQLVSIVTNGVGSMRGFPELGSAQIGNVADYLLSFSTTTTTLPGATTTTTIPRSGAVVYASICALCHGPSGGNLVGHTLSLSEIVSITNAGIGTMPGYSGSLSAAEISNVSQYIASFGASSGVTTTTLPAGTPPSGSTLYMQNCSGCHGLHGEGGVGGAVAGIAMSRSGIVSLIDAGTSGMPAYGSQLSVEEMGAIAEHILSVSFAGGSGGPAGDTIPGDLAADSSPLISPDLREGHSLYDQLCASCHGGRGEGGFGGPLAGIEVSAAGLREIIRQGFGTMPAFAGQMSDSELDALVAFTQALASDPTLLDSTTDRSEDGPDADLAGLAPGGFGNPSGDEGVPVLVILLVIVGVLGAGGAAYLWIRSARSLIG